MTTAPQQVVALPGGGWGLAAAITLGVVGTAGALVLFNGLIKREGVLFSASVTYIIPIFAVMWGLLDGERFGWMELIAGLIVLSGVYLVNKAGPMSVNRGD
jgi:drug/metabolite transporter (DMT)-like permease